MKGGYYMNSLFKNSIVIDAACPLADEKGKYKLWMDGGATANAYEE